jgi:tetratricopeptide (TPR) repeat protein
MEVTRFRPWTTHIEADLDNLRAAFEWCRANASRPAHAAAGLKMLVELSWFFSMNSYHREELSWLSAAMAWNCEFPCDATHLSPTLKAQALFVTWNPIFACGEWHRLSGLAALADEHLARCREAGDSLGTAYCLMLLGNINMHAGDLPRARAFAAASLALFDDARDQRGISFSSFVLSDILQAQHDHTERVTMLETYIRRLQALGDHWHYADLLRSLAWELVLQGKFERASAVCEQLLAQAAVFDDPMLRWFAFDSLRIADHPRALLLAEQDLERQRQAGDGQTLASALHNYGRILLDGADYARARASLDESVAQWRVQDITWGSYSNPAHALCDRGIVARFQGDYRMLRRRAQYFTIRSSRKPGRRGRR